MACSRVNFTFIPYSCLCILSVIFKLTYFRLALHQYMSEWVGTVACELTAGRLSSRILSVLRSLSGKAKAFPSKYESVKAAHVITNL
jgi:hypothetical protein